MKLILIVVMAVVMSSINIDEVSAFRLSQTHKIEAEEASKILNNMEV